MYILDTFFFLFFLEELQILPLGTLTNYTLCEAILIEAKGCWFVEGCKFRIVRVIEFSNQGTASAISSSLISQLNPSTKIKDQSRR